MQNDTMTNATGGNQEQFVVVLLLLLFTPAWCFSQRHSFTPHDIAHAFGACHKRAPAPRRDFGLSKVKGARRRHPHPRGEVLFSHPDDNPLAGDERTLFLDEKLDEDTHDATINGTHGTAVVVNGTEERFIVTKVYHVPPEGFQEAKNGIDVLSLSALFSPEDQQRLRLSPCNVTLPAALMLLDPEQYPSQSRARKAIRQRRICVCRNPGALNSSAGNASALEFDELGKVITRIYAGDVIGHQRRAGSDYYAIQGASYRLPPFEVPVVYEDDCMAIVNKPAGVVMYRSAGGRGGVTSRGGHGRDTLLSALPFVLTPSKCAQDEREPQPVHRLDRPVSGKRAIVLRQIKDQFISHGDAIVVLQDW